MYRREVNGAGKPVVAFDIDGTLGDYHGHFLTFAEQWTGKPMPSPSSNTEGLPLYRQMRVSKAVYRECKLAYRQGGLKRSMPVYPHAAELTSAIRRAGAEVWICTTRPYLRLDNIDPDTRHWLKRNGIKYDAVLYGEDKYRELHRQRGDDVMVIVDDLKDMLDQADKVFDPIHYPRLLMKDQPYNRHQWGYERVWGFHPESPYWSTMVDSIRTQAKEAR